MSEETTRTPQQVDAEVARQERRAAAAEERRAAAAEREAERIAALIEASPACEREGCAHKLCYHDPCSKCPCPGFVGARVDLAE